MAKRANVRLTLLISALVMQLGGAAAWPATRASSRRAEQRRGFILLWTSGDSRAAKDLARTVEVGLKYITDFFGAPFPRPFTVRVFPDRSSLTTYWRAAWGQPGLEPECWMVASGTASSLAVLSPAAWKKDACEHDPSDQLATRRLLIHELVHVYHGQVNPSPDFEDLDEIGWFVEGLAVLASGQLDEKRLAEARKTVEEGKGPSRLGEAWSGKARYGVAGSLVGYVDRTFGRPTTLRLMRCTRQKEILDALGLEEQTLLERWKANLVATKK